MVMREDARRGGARGGVAGRRGPLARPPHSLLAPTREIRGGCSWPRSRGKIWLVRVYRTLRYDRLVNSEDKP